MRPTTNADKPVQPERPTRRIATDEIRRLIDAETARSRPISELQLIVEVGGDPALASFPTPRNVAHTLRRTPLDGVSALPDPPAPQPVVVRFATQTDPIIHVAARSRKRDVMLGAAIGFLLLLGMWVVSAVL